MPTKWDKMRPDEIRDTNASEYSMLQQFYILDARLQESKHIMKNRLAAVKGGARDWAMITKRVRTLLNDILTTMPEKRQVQLCALRDHGHLQITANPTSLRQESKGMSVVTLEDINVVAKYAAQHECSLCLREGKEINRCELRQALINMAPPKVTCAYGCEYRMMVESLMDDIEDVKEE